MNTEICAYGFIYITINNINDKFYIGQKKYDKAGVWKRYLGSGTVFRRAVNKYGRENFTRYIVDEAYSKEELNEKEKLWIKSYEATDDDMSYNIASGGDGGDTKAGYSEEDYIASEEKRIAAVRKGIKRGQESGTAKLTEHDVIEIIDMLKENCYFSDIAEKYGVAIETIRDIRSHTSWKHLTEGIEFDDISYRIGHSREDKNNWKSVCVYDKQLNFIGEYVSAREAERALGVGYRMISQVCKGQRKSAHGYIFRFKEDVEDVQTS